MNRDQTGEKDKRRGIEEAPRLSPEDDEALDRAWARVAAERREGSQHGPDHDGRQIRQTHEASDVR